MKNQQDYLEELKKDKEKYYSNGDYIYANFNPLQKLFEVIIDARNKEYSWDDINLKLIRAREENLKELSYFVKIIPATKEVVILINSKEVYMDLSKSLGENANLIYSKGISFVRIA